MKYMNPIVTLYSACTTESSIHESCEHSFGRNQIKRFHIPELCTLIQSYMSHFLLSAGRKMYVPFVPLAFLVYDPDDKSCMFNTESSDQETKCMNVKDDNRKSKYLIFESDHQNFHIDNRSFDCESRSLKSNYSSFNNEYSGLKSNYPGFNSQYLSFSSNYPSLKSEYRNFNNEYSSLKIEYPSLNSEYVNIKSEYQSLESDYQSFTNEYVSFNSEYQSLKSNYSNLKSENRSLENESCKIAGENRFSKKSHNNLQNIQAWNQSGPDVSNIYREEEDPDRFRMPAGGQHAGLRESIQHWKRCTGSQSINKLSK